MALPSVYSDQLKARNADDERAMFYDKQTVKNILSKGEIPVIPKSNLANITSKKASGGTGSFDDPATKAYNARGSVGGSTSTSKTTNKKTSFDIKKEAEKLKKSAKEQKEEQERKAKERIGKAFDPIYSELDRQLASLPGRKAEAETEIGRLAEGQRATAEEGRTRSIAALESSRAQVEEGAQTSLRDLEGDIRNQLKAKIAMLGPASDSSAAGEVSEAVTREGLKGRAKILSTRDAAFAELEGKRADINNLASDQITKVDEWKSSTLFQIGQDFQDQINALSKEKATASQQEALAIDERITGLEQDFYGRLKQLDDAVLNYKSSIATWQMQREAELEDYAKKLSMSSSYTKLEDDAKKFQAANDVFNQSLAQGMSPEEAQMRAFNQTGVDPLKGLELTPELKRQITENAKKASLFITQDAIGNPVFLNKDNPGAGYSPIPQLGQSSAPQAEQGGGFSDLLSSIFNALNGR